MRYFPSRASPCPVCRNGRASRSGCSPRRPWAPASRNTSLDLEPGRGGEHDADGEVEHFFFLLSGSLVLTVDGRSLALETGGFALVPPTKGFYAKASSSASLLLLRKRYEPVRGVPVYDAFAGSQEKVAGEVYCGDPGARLQVLVPDDPAYDLAMNIFTFEVGHSLPVTETHVMEHGLFVLQGKGLYFLDDEWMEVEAADFIWMGPYCPRELLRRRALSVEIYLLQECESRDSPVRR